ncbi:hypothetical protein D3C85_964700 [compost metagenome]
MAGQRRVLGRFAQAWREWHTGGQGIADFLGHAGHHRGFEDTWGDGHHADAKARQFTGSGQGQADNRAFGGRVGGLADLAVVGGDRGGVDDHAALAVGIGLRLGNGRGGQAQQVETANQVDVDHLAETGQCVRAVLAEDFLATDHAGAVDQPVQAAKGRYSGLDRRFRRRFLGDVGHHALGTQAFGLGGERFCVHVHQHHFGAGADQHFSGGRPQSGSAATDEKNLVCDLHRCFLEFKPKPCEPQPLEPWRFPGCAR